jgi:uncharacterized phiE125 gp8 family phage protein
MVKVTFVSGYPAVPAAIKQAILLLIGQWYQTREAINVGNIVTALPNTVESLLTNYRSFSF